MSEVLMDERRRLGVPGARRRLGVQDALWLEMDHPNNLMVVDSVIWTAEPLDFDRVRDVVQQRLIDRYPVFRSRAVKDDDGVWWWEPDPDFNIDKHVSLVSLHNPDDARSLQELIAAHRTDPLDRDHALWQSIWIKRYGEGSALLLRSHHAIADGMRMVQLAMSLFDATPDGGPILAPAVIQTAAQPHPPGQRLPERLRSGVSGMTEAAGGVVSRVSEAGVLKRAAGAGRFALRNPVGAGATLLTAVRAGASDMAGTVRAAVPGGGRLVDFFSAVPGDVDTVRKLLLGTRNDATIWTGTAGPDKSVSWSESLPLAAVKAVARGNRCTINDVLVACIALSLHDYLRDHEALCSSVTFMVPVNLKPLDLTLPEDLGNEFALVQLELPTDEPDPHKVLAVAKRRMDRIKHGHEAAVGFRFQETIAGLSHGLYEVSVDLFANRTLGTLTNVPGPPKPVYLAGSQVEGIVGWAPVSGNQPMSFTISSYNGRVMVGIACDTALVPDHEMIVEGFIDAFERLGEETPGVVLMPVSWGRAGPGRRKGHGRRQ
jgi:diacylglycerol O-acyltransferase